MSGALALLEAPALHAGERLANGATPSMATQFRFEFLLTLKRDCGHCYCFSNSTILSLESCPLRDRGGRDLSHSYRKLAADG
jgi:hypothetical protein